MRRGFPYPRYASCFRLLAALGPLAGWTGCLKLNADYTSLPKRDDSVQGFESGRPSTSELDSTTPEANSGFNDSTTQSVDSSSPSATSAPVSSTSTTSQTQLSSTSTTQSSGSQDSSSDLGPVPSSWRPITIDTRQCNRAVSSGYTIALAFDHAALVANGAATDGSDLSIVYRSSNSIQSLNRVIDLESDWNQTSTHLWFAIEETIAQDSVDTTHYYMVIGDASLAPVSDPETLFLNFDDFEDSTLDPARWSTHQSSGGTKSISKISVGQRLTARTPSGSSLVYYSIRQPAKDYPLGIRVDVKSRFNYFDIFGTCGRLFPFALKTEGDGRLRGSLRINLLDYDAISYDDAQSTNNLRLIDNEFPVDGPWHTHSLTWYDQRMRYFKGTTQLLDTQSAGTIQAPNQAAMQLELSAGLSSNGCVGSGRADLEVDWVRVRELMEPAPTATVQ